jgi:hypothetical protein
MAEKYINIRLVLDKLLRHPLLQDITLEMAVDYCIDFMRIVGVPTMFEEKVVTIEIKDWRGILPEDYHEVIQVRFPGGDGKCLRYSTDSFHMSENANNAMLTYKIQNSIIYTSMKEGELEIAYKAILVDSEGFPLIPDNSSFIRALQAYIKKEAFIVVFDLGKISQASFQNAQQEYAWAVGDCQTEFNRLSIDKAESFFNSWKTLILRDTQHSSGFKYNGEREYIKLH